MEHYVYFLLGFIFMIIFLKFIIPHPVTQKLSPTLDNYKDITYIDENGTLYQYDLIGVDNE